MPKYKKQQYSISQMYSFYVKNTKNPVSKEVFVNVLDLWGTKVNGALLAGKDVKLYYGLATIGVRKKLKPYYLDLKASKEAKKKVMRPNTHSSGFGARVVWKRHYTTMNTKGWEFEPSRVLSRALAVVMKMPGGHTTFVQQAVAGSTVEQGRRIYNQKIHKV